MNFLAHLYLSGKDENIRLGNFIADAVKGSHFREYPENVARGILLHREIDHFTDTHPVFRKTKSRLVPKYRIYSGIISDLFYDHYLARNWEDYSDEKLRDFVAGAYFLLIRKFHLLPPRSRRMLPFMVTQNWLVGYADFDGLQRVFNGMSRRTEYKSGMENAVADLKQDYHQYEADFREFFPDLISHSEHYLSNLLQSHSSDSHQSDR
jgi:acyl carrier protein phosphodiesterase